MKTTLVTGGCGFIGSHVVSTLLERGDKVVVADNLSTGKLENIEEFLCYIQFYQCDISSSEFREIFKIIKPDYIIHLAAQSSVAVGQKKMLRDAMDNILGTVNVLEAAVEENVNKIVFAASGGTLFADVAYKSFPIQENNDFSAKSFYGLSKLTSVHYLELFKKCYSLDYCALALGNVYGPKQDSQGESGVVSIFVDNLLHGKDCTINGDGETTRDFVYVTDVANAFVLATEKGEGLINIAREEEHSVNEIATYLKQITESQCDFINGPALSGEVRRVCLSIMQAKKKLGWIPKTDLHDGLKKTVDFYASNLDIKFLENINTVFVDAGGVLLQPNIQAIKDLMPDVEIVDELFDRALYPKGCQVGAGLGPGDNDNEFVKQLCLQGGIPQELYAKFKEKLEDIVLFQKWIGRSLEDFRIFTKRMSRLGKKVIIVSNTENGLAEEVLNEVGIYTKESTSNNDAILVDAIYDSWLIGIHKPDPQIYVEVANDLGIDISTCLHIGDSYRNDYYAALKAGAKAIIFRPYSTKSIYSIRYFKDLIW